MIFTSLKKAWTFQGNRTHWLFFLLSLNSSLGLLSMFGWVALNIVVITVKFAQILIDSRCSLVLNLQQSAAFYELIFSILTASLKLLSQMSATCLLRVHFPSLSACKHVFPFRSLLCMGAAKTNWIYSEVDISAAGCLTCRLWRLSGQLHPHSLSINQAWVNLPLNYSAV